jgi:hypothetical protein
MVGRQTLVYLLTEEDFCDGCNDGLLVSSPLDTGDIFNRNRHLERLTGAAGRSCSVSPLQQSQGGRFGVHSVFVGGTVSRNQAGHLHLPDPSEK